MRKRKRPRLDQRIARLLQEPGRAGLLAEALIVVGVTRVGLWSLPSRTVLRTVNRHVARNLGRRRSPPDQGVRQLARAVETVSRFVPQATCLTQALSAQVLLSRRGYASDLRIGVTLGLTGDFAAHAWVETAAGPIIGARDLQRYTPLPSLTEVL